MNVLLRQPNALFRLHPLPYLSSVGGSFQVQDPIPGDQWHFTCHVSLAFFHLGQSQSFLVPPLWHCEELEPVIL